MTKKEAVDVLYKLNKADMSLVEIGALAMATAALLREIGYEAAGLVPKPEGCVQEK